MPRQDVPYGGAICRLKERIAEIWDKLGEKLHSINGVEGDGAGNVEIVSGDAVVVINNDQIGHRIEVALDKSKLPATAVSSVNGKTGAVRLNAADIPSEGNSNVQADIAANKAAINTLSGDIASEQTARQDADAALQGNINSVQASIPGVAAAAVSNDPTVAQLAESVPGKLDKINSGSALKAYTHTGQNQGETDVVNGTDANSIGLRDGNGRMQAADPAAGATDKTLVTANWVSQTGENAPNNLVHKNGNESIDGIKTFKDQIIKTNVSFGKSVLTVNGSAGNCYIYKLTDMNGRVRGSINHQTYINDNHQTRIIMQLQSDDYDTSVGTGATGYLMLELLPSGILQLNLNTTTGDGKSKSQKLAVLTPS